MVPSREEEWFFKVLTIENIHNEINGSIIQIPLHLLALMDPVAVRPDGPLVFGREIKGEICSDHFLHAEGRLEIPVPVVWHRLERAFLHLGKCDVRI